MGKEVFAMKVNVDFLDEIAARKVLYYWVRRVHVLDVFLGKREYFLRFFGGERYCSIAWSLPSRKSWRK
jgi:hypothetical protein